MSEQAATRVQHACAQITGEGTPLTFTSVAARAGLSKATLYRRPELRAIVEEHRARDRDAHSLASLVIQIDQLRLALEAVAAKVRRHEEAIRDLRRHQPRPR